MASPAHHHTLRVYFEDTDAGGLVYHARFLAFAERARTEALRDMGVPHQEMVDGLGLLFLVRRVKVDYLSPARLDDQLTVVTQVLAIGGASVTLDQAVQNAAGTLCAQLEVVLVCVRSSDGRPARVPPKWRNALADLVPPAG